MDSPHGVAMGELEPVRGYSRASVERVVIAHHEERDKLRAALEAAQERRVRAEARVREATELRDRLGAMLLDTLRSLEHERVNNQRSIEAILVRADADAVDLLRSTEAEAARLRAVAEIAFARPPEGRSELIELTGLTDPGRPSDIDVRDTVDRALAG